MLFAHAFAIGHLINCVIPNSNQASVLSAQMIVLIVLLSLFMSQTKDCNVVASKLMFLLDDLLWVLTDSQLKAMMKYAESLSEAMEKSAQQRKSMAPEPVQVSSIVCM